ncbi:MAG: hypothetical protein AAF206_05760 [Bacteroidota bacterium]
MNLLTKAALQQAMNQRDLSNPDEGPHAIQLLIEEVADALHKSWGIQTHIYRESPIVSIADNYDRLRYPADGPARAARYTRYVCDTALLRTSTTAMIPHAMQHLEPQLHGNDLIICPGLVYRRDCIDRLHLAEIHQMDVWRICQKPMKDEDMLEMIQIVINKLLPGRDYRLEKRVHPYTLNGLQIDVLDEGNWIEVGECGLAHPDLLSENLTVGDRLSGLAMGLGLDRILMLRKKMHDIRLVASSHPKIAVQMQNLTPYQPISSMPAVKRDLSLVVADTMDEEQIGAKVRESLGETAALIERLEVRAESHYRELSDHVRKKLALRPHQKNLLLRVVLQALDRSLTDESCNQYRDQIYACLHEGEIWEWATPPKKQQSTT